MAEQRLFLVNLCSIVKAVGNDKIQFRGNRIVPRQQGENRNYSQAVSGQGQGRAVVEEAAQVATLTVFKVTVVAETLVHSGSWNVRVWNKDVESDNYLARMFGSI